MKNRIIISLWTLLLLTVSLPQMQADNYKRISVLQFNIWQEGTMIKGGFDAIVQEIARSNADFVTLSEVRDYNNTNFCQRLTDALKEQGCTYYSFYSVSSGLLSRYPIIDSTTVYPLADDHGSIHRLVCKIEGRETAVYTAHLDYLHCAYYDAIGYNGDTWAKQEPVRDVDSLLTLNRMSLRDDAIRAFLKSAAQDRKAGRLILLGGDFNEPSLLDWQENTKELRHHGLIVPWDVSKLLLDAGFRDSYREIHPDPIQYPGYTYPADCKDAPVEKLTWAAESDERERIDFIYYDPDKNLIPCESVIVGPNGEICKSQRTKSTTRDYIVSPLDVWPTDHKALLSTFLLKSR